MKHLRLSERTNGKTRRNQTLTNPNSPQLGRPLFLRCQRSPCHSPASAGSSGSTCGPRIPAPGAGWAHSGKSGLRSHASAKTSSGQRLSEPFLCTDHKQVHLGDCEGAPQGPALHRAHLGGPLGRQIVPVGQAGVHSDDDVVLCSREQESGR